MSQEIPQPPGTKISLEIIYLKFHSYLRGTNELRYSLLLQIAHLNNKIVEDHEDMASSRQELKETQLKSEQQVCMMSRLI